MIRDMHKDLCKGRPGLCEAMKPTQGAELLKYLRNVEFQGKCPTTTNVIH